MPPIFIIMYAILCLAAVFAVYFLILRYFGMKTKEAALALLFCTIASFFMNLFIDWSFRGIGFIQ